MGLFFKRFEMTIMLSVDKIPGTVDKCWDETGEYTRLDVVSLPNKDGVTHYYLTNGPPIGGFQEYDESDESDPSSGWMWLSGNSMDYTNWCQNHSPEAASSAWADGTVSFQRSYIFVVWMPWLVFTENVSGKPYSRYHEGLSHPG